MCKPRKMPNINIHAADFQVVKAANQDRVHLYHWVTDKDIFMTLFYNVCILLCIVF